MKDILSEYGIRLVEIPRMENDSGVISASKARKMLAEGNYTGAMEYLPETDLNVSVWN